MLGTILTSVIQVTKKMNSNSVIRGRLENRDCNPNRCVVCFIKLEDIKNSKSKYESTVQDKSSRNDFGSIRSNLEKSSESVNNSDAGISTIFLRLFELDIPKSIYSKIITTSSNTYFGFCEECRENVLQIDAFLIQIQILQDQVQEMKGKIKSTIRKSRRYFREKENISADLLDSEANIVRMIRDLTTGVRVALTPIRIPRKEETQNELQDPDQGSVFSSVDAGVFKSENNTPMPMPTAAEAIQPMPIPIEIPIPIPLSDSYNDIGDFAMGIFLNEANDDFETTSHDHQLYSNPGSDPLSLDASAAASSPSLLPLSFELRERKISQSVILPGNDEDNMNNDADESGGDPEFEVFTISSDEDYCVKPKSRSSRKRLIKTRRKPSIRINRAVPARVKSKSVPSPSQVSPSTSKNKNIQKQQPQPQQPANPDQSDKHLEQNEIVRIAIPARPRTMPKPQPHRKSNTKTRVEQDAYWRKNRVFPKGPLFVKGIEITCISNGYKCSVCDGDKTFFTIYWTSISKHVKRKHCEDRSDWLQCETCGKQFFDNHSLATHIRVVHEASDLRPYMCDVCGRQFKSRPPMVNHRHIHDKNRAKFPCEFCGKQFLRVRDCVVHTRTHTKERPFQCDLCPKNFIVRTLLNSHMKTHEASSTLPSLSLAPAEAQSGDKEINHYGNEQERTLS